MAAPTQRLSQAEFIGLTAMIMATTAFSIDAMLPALPEIAQELTPDYPNRAQLMITSFVFGIGDWDVLYRPAVRRDWRRKVIIRRR